MQDETNELTDSTPRSSIAATGSGSAVYKDRLKWERDTLSTHIRTGTAKAKVTKQRNASVTKNLSEYIADGYLEREKIKERLGLNR